MTMRSKQWYTKTSRLSNSFANNSIGRLPDPASATRSSAKTAGGVKTVTSAEGRRKGKKGFPKGKKPQVAFPLGCDGKSLLAIQANFHRRPAITGRWRSRKPRLPPHAHRFFQELNAGCSALQARILKISSILG
jgi:hypothetical protein